MTDGVVLLEDYASPSEVATSKSNFNVNELESYQPPSDVEQQRAPAAAVVVPILGLAAALTAATHLQRLERLSKSSLLRGPPPPRSTFHLH
jgi:hypothetical protein